jgi:hypothetical protein
MDSDVDLAAQESNFKFFNEDALAEGAKRHVRLLIAGRLDRTDLKFARRVGLNERLAD